MTWSDAARKASAEARRRRAKGKGSSKKINPPHDPKDWAEAARGVPMGPNYHQRVEAKLKGKKAKVPGYRTSGRGA